LHRHSTPVPFGDLRGLRPRFASPPRKAFAPDPTICLRQGVGEEGRAVPAPWSAVAMTRPADAPRGEPASELPPVIHLPDDRQRTKKVTSGSENRQRTKAIRVRVLPADEQRLKVAAAAAGMSVAGYLASGRLSDEAPAPPRMSRRPVTVDGPALMQALVAFNRVGNNQNQIARGVNELLLIAREQGNARLESLALELADAIRGLPGLFAQPVAAILAALDYDREG
jgi:hypothetical protein